MEDTTPWVVDRSRWIRKDGRTYPWDTEPDKINWTTAVGLPGMIVRNPMGALCGYAAVPAAHVAYRVDYYTVERALGVYIHGGLTYAAACQGHVCHVPEPGQPDDVWWLGFDCAHAGDHIPERYSLRDPVAIPDYHDILADQERSDAPWSVREYYRDADYVRGQVEKLAAALAALQTLEVTDDETPPAMAGGERQHA